MPRRRVLVIEDDNAIRDGIVDALEYDGYDTFETGCGNRGLDMAVQVACDLVLLDLQLPGTDGLDILREVRKTRPRLPVIILTARGSEEDRVSGLRLGADDYVVKPFSVRELLARVEAVLRRSAERPIDVDEVSLPEAVADFARCEVRFADGSSQRLSEREMELLRYLAQNPGRAISREELLAKVWRIDPTHVSTRTIDMHVARLREKLRDGEQKILVTVRGKGYLFAEELRCDPGRSGSASR